MSNEFESNLEPSERSALEQSLAALRPSPPGIDRDRLMFLAGAASARSQESGVRGQEPVNPKSQFRNPKSIWLWPAATTCLAATSLALALALLLRPDPPARIVYRDRPIEIRTVAADEPERDRAIESASVVVSESKVPPKAIPADNYVRQRDIALQHGLDALGTIYATGGQTPSPLTYGDWLSTSTPLSGAVEKPIRRPFDL